MAMINVSNIHGNQFMKARTLQSPVVIVSARVFRLPSASRDERSHTVTFDSAESPTLCSCTCEAGEHSSACWAMARALDVLTLLGVNKVYVGAESQAPVPVATKVEPAGLPLQAVLGVDGEMALVTMSATPLAGMLLNVP